MSSKRTTSESSQQQVTPQASAEETELNKLYLAREKALDPQILASQQQGLSLLSSLLKGEQLPGYLNTLPGGISKDVQNSIVQDSLRSMNTQMAASGVGTFMESGAAQAAGTRAAADLYQNAEQFNLGNLMQLLNIGVGGQAATMAPISNFSGQFSQRLQGLRGVSSTGNATSTFRYNPFQESFMSSLGQTLGSPRLSFSKGGFSGGTGGGLF